MTIGLNRKLLFAIVSLLLLLADALFVLINYRTDRAALDAALADDGEQLKEAYELGYSMTLANMEQLATFVAGDPRVRETFSDAVDAVAAEGGGGGGQQAAQLRQELYQSVASGWQQMTREYGVRQLHFHLGPGSTSFLRVHRPDKFGDNMDDLRHMVVDVNSDHKPRQGLELGRIYSGLRGIVPVFDLHEPPRQVGALEVGTSFGLLVDTLKQSVDADVAVLMNQARVDHATWQRPDDAVLADCGCFVEASTSPALSQLLSAEEYIQAPLKLSDPVRSHLVWIDGAPFSVAEFAIQDYLGIRDGSDLPVGRVVFWRSAEDLVTALKQATWQNILYAVIGFMLVEAALFIGLRFVFRQLELEVDYRTEEIRQLNSRLEVIAHEDYLTGVCTRRYFTERLVQECNRAERGSSPLALLMLDVDHFKRINDTYGHPAGDVVLSSLGELLRANCRNYDLAGRFGGEEFCLLMPGMMPGDAFNVAEKLRQRINRSIQIPGQEGEYISVSIGVALFQPGIGYQELIRAADEALYEAKGQGRNRVILAASSAIAV